MNTAAFLSRWSQRKRQATAPAQAANARGRSAPSAVDGDTAEHNDSRPNDVEPAGISSEQTVSTSDLPNFVPLESIGAETDIRAFLAAGVPPDLTRAALRRAWLSDPKIRDFVGLADYDWDFNTPGSMAGFGILDASDQIERELARLVRQAVSVTAGETPVSPTPELEPSDEDSSSATSCDPPNSVRLRDGSTSSDDGSEEPADRPSLHLRKHGRDLPK
jgi:hypothetical protein